MPQYGRPSADTNNPGNWTPTPSTPTTLYDKLDEATADDTDYISSPTAPASAVYVTKLSTLEDPLSSTGHIIRWRRQKSASGGAQIDLTVQLRQGYVNEGSQGTLITSQSDANIPATWTTATYTLSAAEADAITNYGDLYLRFVAAQV